VLVTIAPVVFVIAVLMLFVITDVGGSSLLRYGPPQNLAEAAAMATGADVLRRLRAGEDPNALMFVRPEVISSSVAQVTTLEAAIWGREVALIRMLDREGAIGDHRSYLACLSQALRADKITEYLAPHGVGADCGGDEVLRRIQERRR